MNKRWCCEAPGRENKDLCVRYLLYLGFAAGKEVGVVYAVIRKTVTVSLISLV